MPKRANKQVVPIGFWFTEHALKAFQQIGGRDFVPPIERSKKKRRDSSSCTLKSLRVHSRIGVNGFEIIASRTLREARFVGTKIKFERPGSLRAGIGTHAGHVKQTEIV